MSDNKQVSVCKDFTKDTDKRFTLRMDAELFERIAESAKANRRSIAKEIEEAVDFYLKNKDSYY